jgi:hypothetical protein
LAAAELVGGCTGKEFLTALVLGTERAARINSVSIYDGFDPTGICSIFATAAIAGRILHLNSQQMLDALALAFNKSGGSFQSNVDGSLAVRVIQGFVSQGDHLRPTGTKVLPVLKTFLKESMVTSTSMPRTSITLKP